MQIQDQKQKQDIGLVESGNMKINEVVGITLEEFEKLAEKTMDLWPSEGGIVPMMMGYTYLVENELTRAIYYMEMANNRMV